MLPVHRQVKIDWGALSARAGLSDEYSEAINTSCSSRAVTGYPLALGGFDLGLCDGCEFFLLSAETGVFEETCAVV